jgi:ABC-type multidrug transport system fused ATPase/permease subunit
MIKRFNEFLAKHATLALGTMWAFYIFLLYSLLPLVFPQYMDKLMYWSNVIQLITLPLLAVGTAILSQKSEARSKQDHKAIMEELDTIKKMHREIKEIRQNVQDKSNVVEFKYSKDL